LGEIAASLDLSARARPSSVNEAANFVADDDDTEEEEEEEVSWATVPYVCTPYVYNGLFREVRTSLLHRGLTVPQVQQRMDKGLQRLANNARWGEAKQRRANALVVDPAAVVDSCGVTELRRLKESVKEGMVTVTADMSSSEDGGVVAQELTLLSSPLDQQQARAGGATAQDNDIEAQSGGSSGECVDCNNNSIIHSAMETDVTAPPVSIDLDASSSEQQQGNTQHPEIRRMDMHSRISL
jgi:hypothetical protein